MLVYFSHACIFLMLANNACIIFLMLAFSHACITNYWQLPVISVAIKATPTPSIHQTLGPPGQPRNCTPLTVDQSAQNMRRWTQFCEPVKKKNGDDLTGVFCFEINRVLVLTQSILKLCLLDFLRKSTSFLFTFLMLGSNFLMVTVSSLLWSKERKNRLLQYR